MKSLQKFGPGLTNESHVPPGSGRRIHVRDHRAPHLLCQRPVHIQTYSSQAAFAHLRHPAITYISGQRVTLEPYPVITYEFTAAIDYYEEKEIGLGYDFAIEVHEAIKRSVAFPKAWPIIETNIRRTLVRRFPFGILYSEDYHEIYIVAIMNLHREPHYWTHRLIE